jgi:hypothetical protein
MMARPGPQGRHNPLVSLELGDATPAEVRRVYTRFSAAVAAGDLVPDQDQDGPGLHLHMDRTQPPTTGAARLQAAWERSADGMTAEQRMHLLESVQYLAVRIRWE